MRQLIRRIWYAIRHRQLDDQLAEEMDFHRAMTQAQLEARGIDPTEATFATQRAFGSGALAQNRSRDVWMSPWLGRLKSCGVVPAPHGRATRDWPRPRTRRRAVGRQSRSGPSDLRNWRVGEFGSWRIPIATSPTHQFTNWSDVDPFSRGRCLIGEEVAAPVSPARSTCHRPKACSTFST
jgi:hypothetical protein